MNDTPTKEERRLAMLLHLSLFAGYLVPGAGFVVPVVIWQVKKGEMPSIDQHGRNAVNAMITFLIASAVIAVMFVSIILIPVAILATIVLSIAGLVMPVIAAIKAEDGECWKYPFCPSMV